MSYKVLGQADPAANMATQLYAVPPQGEAVVSSLMVCNRGSVAALFRVRVYAGTLLQDNKQYLYYDVEVQGNSTFVFTGGITLGSEDVLTVEASTDDVSFNLFGKEID